MNLEERYNHWTWKALRKRIIERDDYRCRKCGSTDSLHVHHIVYARSGRITSVPDEDLITLCTQCHDQWHSSQDRIRRALFAGFLAGVDVAKEIEKPLDKHRLAKLADQYPQLACVRRCLEEKHVRP